MTTHSDRAADLFKPRRGITRPLTVRRAASRWAWVTDADALDIDTVQAAVDNAPGARIATRDHRQRRRGSGALASSPSALSHGCTVDRSGRLLCRR